MQQEGPLGELQIMLQEVIDMIGNSIIGKMMVSIGS